MTYQEIEQQLKEERKILALHQENLDDFIDQGIKNFIGEDVLREMLKQGQPVWEKYEYEMNRLISEITLSGKKIVGLNMKLKGFIK